MRRSIPVILFLTLIACTRAPVRVVTPAEQPAPAVSATAAGVTLSPAQVSVGATLHNADARAANQIGLDIRLFDARGRTVATTTDSLPWCPGGATCLWGGTFVGSQFGRRWDAIARVAISVRVAYWTERASTPVGFDARREDGTVIGTIPGREGDAYVVGFTDGRPVSGMALVIRREDKPSTRLADAALLPPVTGERLVGAFYPGPVSPGS